MDIKLLVESFDISLDDIERILISDDPLVEWTNKTSKYQLAIVAWLYNQWGDVVVASDPAALSEEYADYTDEGQVSKYLG